MNRPLTTISRLVSWTLTVACLATVIALIPAERASAEAPVAMSNRSSGDGYWTTTPAGRVEVSGAARFFGDARNIGLNKPIVGMASTPSGNGYWLVATDGGIFAYGDARFFGSTGSIKLNQPVVAMASTPSGNGYWLVASDGGVFAYGDAGFLGSTGSIRLNKPVVGLSSTPSGGGYWMVASDGGIFAYGDARFFGSTGSIKLNQPVVAMASTPSGNGYWLVASDGGVFAYGDAPFRGSGAGQGAQVFGMATDGRGGYSLLRSNGSVLNHLAPVAAVTSPPVSGITPPPNPPVVTSPPTTAAPATNPPAVPPTTTPPVTAPPVTAPPPGNGKPFAGLGLWVDPNNPAKVQANAWRTSRPGDADYMDRMGSRPAAVWLGEWSGDVRATVQAITSTAANANQMPVLVAYNIPGRDCGQYSAGGAAQANDYHNWISQLAQGIGNRRAAVVLEPDAIAQLDCLDNNGRQARLAMLRDAVDTLVTNPNTAVYIDAGHPAWHSADTTAQRLRDAGVDNARGFALNVSNFHTTSANVAFGNDVSAKLGGKAYVVDTSRNGNGSNGQWCNPTGRALGESPTVDTGQERADAFLWLKRPGESDGTCNGGPSAGTFWADYALGLAKSAWG